MYSRKTNFVDPRFLLGPGKDPTSAASKYSNPSEFIEESPLYCTRGVILRRKKPCPYTSVKKEYVLHE